MMHEVCAVDLAAVGRLAVGGGGCNGYIRPRGIGPKKRQKTGCNIKRLLVYLCQH